VDAETESLIGLIISEVSQDECLSFLRQAYEARVTEMITQRLSTYPLNESEEDMHILTSSHLS
jgi:hypothetical protein